MFLNKNGESNNKVRCEHERIVHKHCALEVLWGGGRWFKIKSTVHMKRQTDRLRGRAHVLCDFLIYCSGFGV